MTVIATAGHVDHGKSTLVRALTGVDPDRWEEEKARGLTIDLGFAAMTLPSGAALSLVDVPGHTRFLRNMLAGVGAVSAALFVVDAADGWKPQSEEHLRILTLLGIDRGVVALTKVDQVDDELIELAQLDIEEHVEGTFLAHAPVVPVAAPAGTGLDHLAVELDRLVASLPLPELDRPPRLWVDRAFSPAGAGTVVTGTLVRGALHAGDELLISPSLRKVRVRGLQHHSQQVDQVDAGNRVAVNLTGVSHSEVGRGHVLVTDGAWHHSKMVDASLSVLASLDHTVTRRGAYLAYIGSAELPVKVRVLTQAELMPGEEGKVRLYLPQTLPLLPGDRYILRESGREETVGGGEILDVSPRLPASKANPDRRVERVVAERGWVKAEQLGLLTGTMVEPTVGDWVVAPEVLNVTTAEVLDRIEQAGPLGLDIASLDDHQRAVLELLEDVTVSSGRALVAGGPDPLADHPWVAALEQSPFSPPGVEGVDRGEVRELVRRGTIVEQDGVYFALAAVNQAIDLVAELLAANPTGFTVAQARDVLATTRKYVLPLMAHLDKTGVTRRLGDVRVGGPRLPARP